MTTHLEEAIRAVEQLSPAEQDAIAGLILAEVRGDAAWEAAFSQSSDVLAALAEEAIAERRCGDTRPLDISKI